MAGSVNKVILVGNLGADPEINRTQDGRDIASFSLATSESWRDKTSGERKERTEWHRVVVFNEGLAGICANYLKKGSKVYLEGQLQTRKWTDRDGLDRYTTEVVLKNFAGTLTMLDKAGSGRPDAPGSEDDYGRESGRTSGGQGGGGSGNSQTGGDQPGGFSRDLDDDIPF